MNSRLRMASSSTVRLKPDTTYDLQVRLKPDNTYDLTPRGVEFLGCEADSFCIDGRRQRARELSVEAHGVHDDPLGTNPVLVLPHPDIRRGLAGRHLRVVAFPRLHFQQLEIAAHLRQFLFSADRTVPGDDDIDVHFLDCLTPLDPFARMRV